MIHIPKNQLEQVEYLIHQSKQGNHLLFDAETLRMVLENPNLTRESDAYAAEPHIEKLLSLPSLAEKKGYLQSLDRETLGHVVRTYFNIVENELYESMEIRH